MLEYYSFEFFTELCGPFSVFSFIQHIFLMEIGSDRSVIALIIISDKQKNKKTPSEIYPLSKLPLSSNKVWVEWWPCVAFFRSTTKLLWLLQNKILRSFFVLPHSNKITIVHFTARQHSQQLSVTAAQRIENVYKISIYICNTEICMKAY